MIDGEAKGPDAGEGTAGEGAPRFDWALWNRRRYTALAPFYDPVVGQLAAARRRSLEGLDLRPGQRVLLFGAGTGLDLPLLPRGLDLVAIDITPAMLERLRRKAARLDLAVDARVMDGRRLEFADASFDAVVAHLILAVMPEPERGAREIARVLKPGGRVAVFDKFLPEGGRASWPRRAANAVARWVATEINRQLHPILAGSGLRIVEDQPALWGGFFRRALAVKEPAAAERAGEDRRA